MKILYDTQASAVACTVLRSLLAHKDEAATTSVKMIFCDRSGVNLKRFSIKSVQEAKCDYASSHLAPGHVSTHLSGTPRQGNAYRAMQKVELIGPLAQDGDDVVLRR